MEVLRFYGFQFGLGHAKLRFGLLQRLFLGIGRSAGSFDLIHGDELFFKEWLEAVQIVGRVGPLGFGARDTLLSILHASPCLIFSRNKVRDIGLGRIYAGLGR